MVLIGEYTVIIRFLEKPDNEKNLNKLNERMQYKY